MTITVVGLGPIGRTVSSLLGRHGHPVVVASRNLDTATSLAADIGAAARSLTLTEAIGEADVLVLAVPFGAVEDLVERHGASMTGTVVVDPTNALSLTDDGRLQPLLPEGRSAGSVIASAIPPSARYVKALGTTTAGMLRAGADRSPRRAVLPYATEDDVAAEAAASLITAIGFDPVRAGGVAAALRLEMFGDLHTLSGFGGRMVDLEEFSGALSASAGPSARDGR